LPALMIGSVAALAVTVLLLRRSILTEKLARRGQHVTREYAVDVFELIRVGEVMDRRPPLVAADTPMTELAKQIAEVGSPLARRQATLITENGELAGIVTRGDLLRAQQAPGAGTLTVLQAGTAQPVTAFVDETLSSAMSRMLQRDIGRLPVVERGSPRRVVGYLGRSEILAARLRHRDEESRRERWPFPARDPA